MYDTVKTPVRVSNRTDAEKFNYVVMEVQHLSMFERSISAFGALVICWFAAVLFVAIPVMHFVLVPLGLIAGVAAFIYKLTRHERKSETNIKCPSCKAALKLKAGAFNWPIKENCGECRVGLLIEARQ